MRFQSLLFIYCVVVALCKVNSVLHAAPGDLLYVLESPTPQPGALFGGRVVEENGIVYVGEPGRSGGRGQAYAFNAVTGELLHTFVNPHPASGDRFGGSIAAGDGRVAFGQIEWPAEEVFIYNATTYALERSVRDPTRNYSDPGDVSDFGRAIAWHNGRLLVGAPSNEVDDGVLAGSAFLFDGITGERLFDFDNPDHEHPDGLGSPRAIEFFRNDLVVGTWESSVTTPGWGRFYVVDGETGEVRLDIQNPRPGNNRPWWAPEGAFDRFGGTVSTSQRYILAGAHEADIEGINAVGIAYLFDGETGELLHTLQSPILEEKQEFGFDVAMVGENALVGAQLATVDGLAGAGAVYLFDGSTGELLLEIPNPDPGVPVSNETVIFLTGEGTNADPNASLVASNGGFGGRVSAIGNNIAVSNIWANGSGRVYVYEGVQSVPEPSAVALLGILLGVFYWQRYRIRYC